MKKILICANTTWYLYNFRTSLIRRLILDGYKVYIVSGHDNYIDGLTEMGCEHLPFKIESKSLNPLNELRTFLDYFLKVRRIRPDLILNFTIKPSIYGTLIGTFFSIRTINTITGLGTAFLRPGLLQAVTIKLYSLSLRFADHVFFQNKDDREFFINSRLVTSDKSSIVAGSGIDLSRFSASERSVSDKFTFLYIGRLIGDKGLRELVEAGRNLILHGRPIQIKFLGPKYPDNRSAIQEAELEIWIKEGVVEYLGPTDKVEDFIKECDCVVLPSYREGLPRVLLEAAAMAKPVIATNVPGCREVVVHGVTGLLCKVKDAGDLEERMLELFLMDEAQRVQMGLKAREFVQCHFDENLVINEYLRKCEKLVLNEDSV